MNGNGRHSKLLRATAFIQAGYYISTGIWSLVSISTFQMVTGPKTDIWLVKTVGLLVIVSGLVILYSAVKRSFPLETVLLGAGNAVALACIEIFYFWAGTISLVYLLDAVVEIIFAVIWVINFKRLKFKWVSLKADLYKSPRPGRR